MSFEKIDSKYLTGKRKQVLEWDSSTGSVKVVIYGTDGKIEKETLKECKK